MVNVNKIKELCKEKGVSASFLCRKIGVATSYFNDLARYNANIQPQRVKIIADALDTTPEYLLDLTDDKARPNGVKVKIYGTIAAGIPIDAIEDVIDEEEIPAAMAKGGEYIGLKVKGDSMEPLIPNGAYAILRCQPDCENGQIAAVLVNGNEATLKRVMKLSNGITLIPENPKYQPMSFSNDEIEKAPVTIIGVLKETRMKF